MTRHLTVTLFFCLALFVSGCKVHQKINVCDPRVCVPEEYAFVEEAGVSFGEWWREFESPELNLAVENVLRNNLDLKQSWWKVVQACHQARVEGARRWPELNINALAGRTKNAAFAFSTGASGVTGGVPTDGGTGTVTSTGANPPINFYQISPALNYEIDLWRRVDSRARAACYQWKATKEDLEATALILTGTAVDLWFTIQEQETLLEVINHQIEVSQTLLELVELRFSVGQSSALDVYQQRLQLASTITQRTPVESLLQTSINQMHVLMGSPPNWGEFTPKGELVDLPPFPNVRTPVDLIKYRPDLRAEQRRLMAADYEVAAAIAERLPRLDISLSYDFEATMIRELFNGEAWQILETLVTPIFDGGRRKAEVGRRRAIVCELINQYGAKFLDAMLEVEDAIVQEKFQLKFLEELKGQIKLAETNLEEAHIHYINGLNDYLTVIAAVQSLQDLQRRMVSEKKILLIFRSKLYRSLGGPYFTHCYL